MQCTVAPESTIDLEHLRFLADLERRDGGLPVTFILGGAGVLLRACWSLVLGVGMNAGVSPASMHAATRIERKATVLTNLFIRNQSLRARLRAYHGAPLGRYSHQRHHAGWSSAGSPEGSPEG